MTEHEVHADEPPDPSLHELAVQQRRTARALIALRDEIRASQSAPPRWLTANWKNLLIIVLAAASLIGRGDAQAVLGMLLGYGAAHAPTVVSPPSAPAPVAPETP